MALTITVQAIWIAGGFVWSYLAYGIVFRLYLSPLAKTPRPPLAALTRAYELCYDYDRKTQEFPWKIEELHKLFGSDIGTI